MGGSTLQLEVRFSDTNITYSVLSGHSGRPTCFGVLFVVIADTTHIERPLEATESIVALRGAGQPLIVVGLPRSGTSFLAHVLSAIDNWYVFDDLYAVQKAMAINPDGPLSDAQLRTFLDRLAWETRARVKFEVDFRAPDLTLSEIDFFEAAMVETFRGRGPMWHEVTAEWMTRLALHHGCDNWGYKTPQDFMHVEWLRSVWPGARFIWMIRDPREIMRSLKNLTVHSGGDGDPRQFHPVVTSLYWKASRTKLVEVQQSEAHEAVEVVDFDELRTDPDSVAERLAKFVDSRVANKTQAGGKNSSMAKPKAQELTDTDIWISQKLIGSHLSDAGFEKHKVRPRLGDVPELLRSTAVFAWFQLHRSVTDAEKRKSIIQVGRRLF